VFSKVRLIGAVLGVALIAGGLWLYWSRTQAAAERGQPRRIAILPIENLTGRASLEWTGRAMIEVAQLELGAGEEAAVFPARDAGEAAARQATDLAYGTLELAQPSTGDGAPRLRYALFIENAARHTVIDRQRGTGTALNAASALAALLARTAGVRAPRPAGVRDDRTLELFSKQKYEECTQADRQAYWCWERWAVSTFEAGKKEDALRIVAQGRAMATAAPAAARARLDFAEATFRGDPALRLAALERLVQADPGSPGAITELASQFVAQRHYAEAESLYRRALEANRGQSDVWNLLAYAQAWQGRFDEARKSVEEYDRLAPTDPNPADSRGEIEMLAGNLGAAQAWFLNSYHRDAKFNSGAALEKAALASYLAGNEKVAAQLVGAYLAEREKAGDALAAYARARWQFLFGQGDAAQSALENVVRRGGPDAALAATRLMLAALRNGETETARRWAGRVRELTPATGNPLLAHIAALLGQGDAKGVSDAALRTELQAVGLTLRAQFAQALPVWDEALKGSRGGADGFAREMQAWCLVRTGKTADAARLVQGGWPLLADNQRLLFDFLIYPNSLFVRAEAAAAGHDAAEARRLYDLYLRYAGPGRDRFGQLEKARAASRL
jgi:Flp pilus assembly protein TadD